MSNGTKKRHNPYPPLGSIKEPMHRDRHLWIGEPKARVIKEKAKKKGEEKKKKNKKGYM
jgi:hypothetical protein